MKLLLALLLAGAPSILHAQSLAPAAGPSSAPVTAIVFSDFACPYSAQMSYVLDTLERRYPTQLRVVFRQSPLSIHPAAPLAHRAALAAGRQGHYAEMSALLYANQAHQDAASLSSYARQLHLDPVRFRRDLQSPAVSAQLAADMEEARGLAVESTPTLFINGRALTGFQTLATLASTVDAALAQADPAAAAHPARPAEDEQPAALSAETVAALTASPSAAQGPGNAPLTIVEFTDFQCPFCRSAVAPMQQLLAERGREVRWVFRAFPLDFHPDAELAAEAALAAGAQGKFWPMHDLLFAHQDALKEPDLHRYAAEAGLDVARFHEDLVTHRFAGQVAADRALGAQAGVGGTPTFFVDGHAISGVRSLPELRQIADAHLLSRSLTPQSASVVKPAPRPARPVSGPDSAPLTLTWYTDVRSGSAPRQAELVRALATLYGSRVRVLYRAFPLDAYPDSGPAAQALLAAEAQGAFWLMFDRLTAQASAPASPVLDRAGALALAASLGLQPGPFASAFDAAEQEVAADRAEAERRGIRGAPVVYVNAQRVDGLQALGIYTGLADSELAQLPVAHADNQPAR